ncbi:MAG: class I adenylate-forming enzyme family protein [Azospirillaceae bacterium]|nr:class I adenylate-forming enzyme family protein [Azospirillaceae bacterium]
MTSGALGRNWEESLSAQPRLLRVGDGRIVLTGKAMLEGARQVAERLRVRGVVRSEAVPVFVANRASDLVAVLGVWLAGAVVVPIHQNASPDRVASIVTVSGARFLIDNGLPDAGPDGGTALSVAARTPSLADRIVDRSEGVTVLAHEARVFDLLQGAALVMFNSASTVAPRGVVIAHDSFQRKLAAIDTRHGFNAACRTQVVLPITISAGLWMTLLTLLRGGSVHLRQDFSPLPTLDAIAEDGITHVALVPAMLRALVAAEILDAVRDRAARIAALGRLTDIFTGGDVISASVIRAVTALFPGAVLTNGFGRTETGTCDLTTLAGDLEAHPGAVGRPTPGVRVRIVGEDGQPVAPGTVGELQILTPFIMSGYLGAPDMTRAAFDGNWFRTGDLAFAHADGVVEVLACRTEVMARGATKVYPQEVEQAFVGHPAVQDVLATGVPDPLLGERIHLAVVLRGSARPGVDDLQRWAAPRLETVKFPDQFHFTAALPIGGTGRFDRGRLRQMITDGRLPRSDELG